MTQAKAGDTVRVHYTGTLEDGTTFDSSRDREPLEFKIGEGQLIAGFEEAIKGMSEGDTKRVTIPCEEAYGPHLDEQIAEVPREQLPEDVDPQPGMMLQAQAEDGRVARFRVTEVGDDSITIDGNHPLAGKTLIFDLEVVDIKQ